VLNRRLRAVIVAAATAAAVLTPGAAQAQAFAGTSYVALGDSYAAGLGAPPYLDPTCLRSDNGYPALVAAEKKVGSFRSDACSGAKTADLLAGQLGGLNRRTGLVTVTIGGNDLGFSSGVGTCMQGDDKACLTVVEDARKFTRETLPARLDAVYAAVRQRAPRATLVVTGYAHFFEATAACAAVPPATPAKRAALNSVVDTLNQVIAGRAARAGARFADPRPAFTGHGLCGADPWITAPTDTAPFHPNAAGYRNGYLAAVRQALVCR
jgi:lysophospholipase L1-like esterase